MPIEVSTLIRACSQEEFHAVDRQIMRVAFDVHNDFGRLLDETLYKRELATRCLATGIEPIEREVRIRVTHESFAKDYSMDLLFCRGSMLDSETAFALTMKQRHAIFMRDHLERLLRHTSLKAIQWINLNRHLAEFTTLRLSPGTNRKQNHPRTESLAKFTAGFPSLLARTSPRGAFTEGHP